jgi:branched-chain amino acid transport system ATP-binding protein
VVVIEQDIGQALRAADRVYCLLEGRVALEGAPRDLDRDRIAAAYFGVRA